MRYTNLLIIALLVCPGSLFAQARTANRGGSRLAAGGFVSDFSPDYGPNRLIGVGGFADLTVGQHVGGEAEVRFLRWNQKYNIHEDMYLVGLRYVWHFDQNRVQPYAKVLVGDGQFNFPFNYAHGGYFVLAPGAGLDYRLSRHFFVRGDYEYQHWNNFQKSSLTPNGFTLGIGYRVF